MSKKITALALVALGWLTSGYLFYRLTRLGAGTAGADVCSAVFGRGCDETLASPSSFQFGFPLAGWGLVYFAVVGLLLAIGNRLTERAALLLAAAGAGASLVMTWGLLFGRTSLCPLCLVVHVANFGLVTALWFAHSSGEAVSKKKVRSGSAVAPVALLALSALPALIALITGVLFQSWAGRPGGHGAGHVDRAEVLAAFAGSEQFPIPVSLGDKVSGSPEAPVQLVVFSSFQCPACRSFAVSSRHLAEHFGDQVAIVFKHFPLESECNPAVSADLQPRSCDAAWAAEAAHLQGAFWQFHDGLFDSDLSATEDMFAALAIGAGLDLAKWRADRESFAVRSRVQGDAELGLNLEVNATPSVYLNGRFVPNPSIPVLEVLMEGELDR